jgi:hypothetical protein
VEWMIDAPHRGATIQIRRMYDSGFIGGTRPLAASSLPVVGSTGR